MVWPAHPTPHTHDQETRVLLLGGWVRVGRGPHSGRASMIPSTTPPPPKEPPQNEEPSFEDWWGVVVCVCACIGRLVPVSSMALTGCPLLVYQPSGLLGASHPTKGAWIPHLEDGFPLRCFQRLPVPNVANQPCPWRDNWHTRGSSVPVLSY